MKRLHNVPFVFSPMPRSILREWMRVLDGNELKCYSVIIDRTYGTLDQYTGKARKTAQIPIHDFMVQTGLARTPTMRALASLADRGLIRLTGPHCRPRTYEALMGRQIRSTCGGTTRLSVVPQEVLR